jgi:type II secretory pathway pseudopilin PulG
MRRRQGGFTYLGMIILVTVLGLVGAATLKIDSLLRRAAMEEELLFVGAAFSDALTSYAAATPQGQPTQPPTMQDLLRDNRSPAIRRHLRKVFVDPMTGTTDWGIVWLADQKGILAVYSKSNVQPLKIANFDPRLVGFEGRTHVSDWRFVANAPQPALTGAPAAAVAATPASPATTPPPVSLFPAAPVVEQPVPPAAPPPPPPTVEEPKPEEEEEQAEPPSVGPVRRE